VLGVASQEVKYAAIAAMGALIATYGDELTAEARVVEPILLERCRNETTRPAAVRAVQELASSWLHIDLRPVLGDLLDDFTSFLRKVGHPPASARALGGLMSTAPRRCDEHMFFPHMTRS